MKTSQHIRFLDKLWSRLFHKHFSLLQVLITIYWLGRAANGCTSYNGPTLDLKEFEGLLSQMRKVCKVI